MRGSCDGVAYGRSGCGVLQGLDRDRWITISKIAVPLKACTAMAADAAGASILTVILDLVLRKTISVEAINQCINDVIKLP